MTSTHKPDTTRALLPKYDQEIGWAIWLEKLRDFHREVADDGRNGPAYVFGSLDEAIAEADREGWLDSAYHLIPLRAGQHQRRPFYVATQRHRGEFYASVRANDQETAEARSAELLDELRDQWKRQGNELATAVFTTQCQRVIPLV